MEEKYFVSKEKHAYALDPNISPVLEVIPPCTVTFETGDMSYTRLAQGETIEDIGFQNFNVVTGPVFVHGAEAGDALCVEVLEVTVRSAWSAWVPGLGRWGNKTDKLQIRQIPLKGEWAIISERIRVPIEPMIGCIGLAPTSGSSSTVTPAYPWGGNLDLRELGAGSTIYLPVQVPGALLSIGDLHTAMGTAEPTAVSLEAAGQAIVRITVEKNLPLKFPRVRSGNETICVAVADSFADARQLAMDQAYDYLTEEIGLTPFDAYAYASARVSLRFGGPASAIVLAIIPDIEM